MPLDILGTMQTADPRAFVRNLLRWGRQNRREFPWRGETDTFRIVVAEVLLQRSRGTTVAGVYEALFQRWPSARELAQADVEEVRAVIRPLGLTSRAELLVKFAQQVMAFGRVPDSLQEMTRLAGVGRYAASASLAQVTRQRHPVVDGTSARVYRRYFGLEGTRDSEVDEALWGLVEAVSPKRPTPEWNWAVLDLAAAICLPKVPKCVECPLRQKCFTGRHRTPILSQPPA